jgi:hypothetical protein
MKILKHDGNDGKEPRWEIVMDGESVFVDTEGLQSHSKFRRAAQDRSLRCDNNAEHARAFTPLMTPMTDLAWQALVREALAKFKAEKRERGE